MLPRFSLSAVLAALCVAVAPAAVAQDAKSSGAPAAAASSAPVDHELSADLFYRLMLGDVALQRGDLPVAARAYLDAAQSTNASRLAARALEIAIAARERKLVEDAAQLWARLDPAAERPKHVLEALAANGDTGAFPETAASDALRSRIEHVLSQAALSGSGVGEIFLQLNRLFSQQSDRHGVLSLVRDVAKPYPKTPEAHYAVASAAFAVGEDDKATAKEARDEIDQALELRPEWERAAILKAEILERSAMQDAMQWLESFVTAHPDAKSAAGALAQMYVDRKRFADARALMQKLWDREPSSRDLEFAVATIAISMKDYAEAERLLEDLHAAGYGDAGVIDLYLAQVAEETRQWDKAIKHYEAVTEGDRAWLARLRIGAMYSKKGEVEKAHRYLAGLTAVTQEQKIQVTQAQAQLYRDAGNDAEAYSVLTNGLADHPDAPDLIYDIAMVAERLDKVDEAESRLKRLVDLRPNDAQALNALGYTLVDRTPRTDEGLEFIERAHKLAPRDPFILDSLGWAFYRKGRLDDAERYLQQALDGRPDAEIAAHLGTEMWPDGACAAMSVPLPIVKGRAPARGGIG